MHQPLGHEVVEVPLAEDHELVQALLLDRLDESLHVSTQLYSDGFAMVAFGQSFASMNWRTKKLEEVVISRWLRHGGNPVLRWMGGNVSIETDAADNWKPSKKRSCERIDGIVALIMALERATTGEAVTGPLLMWGSRFSRAPLHDLEVDRELIAMVPRTNVCHHKSLGLT
jgi:phage terminase large subunit-like protein